MAQANSITGNIVKPISSNKPTNHHYLCLKDTSDSIVEMGKVNMDGIISAFKVTCDTNHGPVPHYFQMDKTGSSKTSPRKGGTIFRGPGAFQVRHGDAVEKGIPGVYIESATGHNAEITLKLCIDRIGKDEFSEPSYQDKIISIVDCVGTVPSSTECHTCK